MKKTLSILLALILIISSATTASFAASFSMENFKRTEVYFPEFFTDVKESAWYEENVRAAFEYGLVKGQGANKFNPNGNITIAETLALAARLNSIYNTGSADFVQGSPWYQVYVDYAIENNIISGSQFTNYNKTATRADFALIMGHAMLSGLSVLNEIDDGYFKDVTYSSYAGTEIYTLCITGIITGYENKTFKPDNTISRAEVAAIVTRMAVPDLRVKLDLETLPEVVFDDVEFYHELPFRSYSEWPDVPDIASGYNGLEPRYPLNNGYVYSVTKIASYVGVDYRNVETEVMWPLLESFGWELVGFISFTDESGSTDTFATAFSKQGANYYVVLYAWGGKPEYLGISTINK